MNINLHAKPYASHLDRGYNKKGEVYDIEVLNSTRVMEQWDRELEMQGIDPLSDEAIPLFKDWCAYNNVYYYGRTSAHFHESEALDLAAESCSRFLLMEDMS